LGALAGKTTSRYDQKVVPGALSDPIFVFTAVPATLGILMSAYVLVTGRWITWPIRPRNVPISARDRRLVASGMLLFFLMLSVGDLFFLPALQHFASGMRLFELPLVLAATGLVRLGWKLPPRPIKHYGLEGWPPLTASERR
jgi:hypothetical protein